MAHILQGRIQKSMGQALTGFLIHATPKSAVVRYLLGSVIRFRTGAHLSFGTGIIDVKKDNRVIRISDRHLVYVLDLASQFESYFNPVAPQTEAGNLLVDYSTSKVHRFVALGLEFELISFPEEQDVMEGYFRWYRPQANDTVFDVGAHCGTSTYVLSKLVGEKGRVVAFEPDPAVFAVLRRNLERHGLTNVIPVQAAMAGSNGSADFFAEGALGSSLVRTLPRPSMARPQQVRTLTLEQACSEFGTPSFCKIDIEAAEVEALTPMIPFLRAHRIHFALDTNHYIQGNLTNTMIEAIFQNAGYRVESSDADRGLMTTWAAPLD